MTGSYFVLQDLPEPKMLDRDSRRSKKHTTPVRFAQHATHTLSLACSLALLHFSEQKDPQLETKEEAAPFGPLVHKEKCTKRKGPISSVIFN